MADTATIEKVSIIVSKVPWKGSTRL